MVWRRLLLVGLSALMASGTTNGSVWSESPANPPGCSEAIGWVGCPQIGGDLESGEAVLDGVVDGGSGVGAPLEREGLDVLDEEWNTGGSVVAPPLNDNCSPLNVAICRGNPEPDPAAPAPAPDVVVTLRDIASFRPAKPGNGMEPGGWAIEDLPANFVAAASVEVVSGTLLGRPADVRFTPVGYRWTHSDGAVVESAQPGANWATLGLREFSTTPTSHSYAESGEYTVELSVVLRAEYRFAGSGWRAIAGTLSIAGEPQRVLVGQFDTVLTQGDCNTHPSGPGC